jgi:hypothetical protein
MLSDAERVLAIDVLARSFIEVGSPLSPMPTRPPSVSLITTFVD